MKRRKTLLILISIFGLCVTTNAQEEKTVETAKRTDYKNVVKFNISSQVIYNKTILFGYERVIKKHQSVSIFGGYMEFPFSLNLGENVQLLDQKTKSGYTIGADWRFYLARENKNPVPHGVYLAPFVMLHHFANDRDIQYTDTSGNVNMVAVTSRTNFFTIGGQLGYQFVIKRRFVIDAAMFGPAITRYDFNVKVDGNLTPIEADGLREQIINAMKDKYPFLEDLASGEEVSGSGVESFWSVGFRYSISIGFRF